MYCLFLVVCVVLVTLSPLALEFYLTTLEHRRQRRKPNRLAKLRTGKGAGTPWTPARARW